MNPAPTQPPLVPGAGPRPFRSTADVLALMPALISQTDIDPIRDALVAALTQLVFECEAAGEYAAAQADVLRATGVYLDALGGTDLGSYRDPDEEQEPYRARVLSNPGSVTEDAIRVGVNIILAPFTATECQIFDSVLDRWYVHDGSPEFTWHSYLGASPEYPDRLYAGQEALNGGAARPNSDPGGARVFDDHLGRQFVIRLPDLSHSLDTAAFIYPTDTGPFLVVASIGLSRVERFYVYADPITDPLSAFLGLSTEAHGYVNTSTVSDVSIYRTIERFVDSVVGQSIRWGMSAELVAL